MGTTTKYIYSSVKYIIYPSTSPIPTHTPQPRPQPSLTWTTAVASWLAVYSHPGHRSSQQPKWNWKVKSKSDHVIPLLKSIQWLPSALWMTLQFCSMDTRPLVMVSVHTLNWYHQTFWSLITHAFLHLPQSCPEGCFSTQKALHPLIFWLFQLILQITP